MKIYVLLIVLLAEGFSTKAQQDTGGVQPSRESIACHARRVKITEPPYNLLKVKTLIALIHSTDDQEILDQKKYLSLSFREKYTYHMIHGETYSQNCDAIPDILEEDKKIFAQLPDIFGEYSWSERQLTFFRANRDSVISLMRSSINADHQVGLNFKSVMVEINANEMIPLLIRTYQMNHNDHDILTVLMLLMKNNEYPEFMLSSSYKKLYADRESSYSSYLAFNKANQDLIIKRALDFYHGVHKE